jgi:hypothetical protein
MAESSNRMVEAWSSSMAPQTKEPRSVPFGTCYQDRDFGEIVVCFLVIDEAAALVAAAGFGRVGTLLLAGRFTVRADLRAVFADSDLDLLVAI